MSSTSALLLMASVYVRAVTADSGDCDSSTLVQLNQQPHDDGMLQVGTALRQDMALLGLSATSSPEFNGLVNEIGAKMRPFMNVTIQIDRCLEMVQALTQVKGSFTKQHEVHTGAFLQGDMLEKSDLFIRKLRLAPLSFLATQDLKKVKLHFWSNLEPDHPLVREIFSPMLLNPTYAESIEISKFDPDQECAQAFPTSIKDARMKSLYNVYTAQRDITSLSDIMRVTVLHNYGGTWIDSDVLLIRDMSPVMGEDWAYLGQKHFVNNAVMSTSRPRSPFMQAYLSYVVGRDLTTGHYQYGPAALRALAEQVQELPEKAFFHVLPTCFFDGGWVGVSGSSDWDEFFTRAASPKQVEYITPGATSHNAFAYHWHGRWPVPIQPHSLADQAERLYFKVLDLDEKFTERS